jgi:menaquinone-dependent protoporphyrinogen oxidase
MTILVTAASRHGATYEIAEEIGRALMHHGLETEVVPIEDVRNVADYDAVVIGSAVYLGQWLEPARSFVEHRRDELALRPTWLFSSGPIGGPPRPRARDAVHVDDLVEATAARDHRLFTGRLDRHRLGFRERAVVFAFHAEEGDFRNWGDIADWAAEIANALQGCVRKRPVTVVRSQHLDTAATP